MKSNVLNKQFSCRWLFAAILLVVMPILADVKGDDLPKNTDDGLELVNDTKLRAVYMKPGANLDKYRRVAILDCDVEFEKNWEHDYNRGQAGIQGRISQKDMDRIKQRLADEFRQVFTKVLEDGDYKVVTDGAPDVLVVRPAIVNLSVTAPDTMRAGMESVIVSSAGQMTLYMELYDSVSSELLARVIDPQIAREPGNRGVANRATNKAAADRVIRRWAGILRDHLGAVQQP